MYVPGVNHSKLGLMKYMYTYFQTLRIFVIEKEKFFLQ